MSKVIYTIHKFTYEDDSEIATNLAYSIDEFKKQGFSFYSISMEPIKETLSSIRFLVGEDMPGQSGVVVVCYCKRVDDDYIVGRYESSSPFIY